MIELYREVCNNRSTITEEEVQKAEALMMVRELSGRYAGVYSNWKSQYASSLDTQNAASGAGDIICRQYELPDETDYQADIRAKNAEDIYLEMIS